MEHSSLAGRVTKRFVAGQTLDEELALCAKLHQEGILTTLDYLGENVSSLEEAQVSSRAYLDSLHAIAARQLPSTVSIKLTQFGLDFSTEACQANVAQLVDLAQEIGTRVEIDMESSEYTDRTLQIVHAMHQRAGNVRAVIQAYLHRSEADIRALNAAGIPVRLCKGAYQEPADVALPAKPDVDRAYVELMKLLLDEGVYAALATHDEAIIGEALRHVEKKGYAKDRFEFQMLYGIRRDLQRRLTSQGFRLRLYVPYGEAWYPYFMRRLAERPANALFLLRNLVRS
jgi:proline dehydrogenase